MASIWSGRHLESGIPVAAKLIPPGKLTDKTRASLTREVQTAASLDHPGIICIVDQGTIDAAAARASDGRIDAGAPYLIMEFCSHTLGSLVPITSWGELRTILVSLLDALAYAHARGVIHRDLKPGNVLFGGPEDLRPGLKIADFGIAHALDAPDPETGARKLMGTPRYMSPEQVEGDPRLLGPGTDLYSLAAMVFKCVHGHGPFQTSGARLLYDHLRTPAPRLDLPPGFPPGLADWTAWLLHKDVFQRPASAAAALRALPDGPLYPLVPPDLRDEEAPTVPLATARLSTLMLGDEPSERARFQPIPASWSGSQPYGGSPRLRDVGHSLVGLRPVPLAGRVGVRDLLWTAFRQSANRAACVTVLLSGQEGLGRTRLVDWLQHRVLELGCGTALRIAGQRRQQRAPMLRGFLADLCRIGTATGEELKARLEAGHARLGLDVGPLVGFALRPEAEPETVAAATAQLLGRLAALGPVVVTIDDIHLVPSLLQDIETWQNVEGPLLLVLTAREEGLVDPELAALPTVANFHRVLSPLAPQERQDLIDSILPLSPSLSALVDQRTAGNPRFAIQLLTDWVQRGVLLPGPSGFEAPRDLELPASLQAIWSSRVRHLLAGFDRDAGRLLEIAATLGNEVLHDDLNALLPDREAAWQALATRMVLHRLVVPTPEGFAFSHPAIREVLLHRAARGGRLAGHHAAIASLLRTSTDPEQVARRGHHRAGAGDREGAFTDLIAAARFTRDQAQFKRTLILCDEAQALLEPGDRRCLAVMILRARTLNSYQRHGASRQEAEGALEVAEINGWVAECAGARLQVAIADYHKSDYAGSRAQLLQVLQELDQLGSDADPEVRAAALNHVGWTWVLEGEIPTSLPWFARAAEAQFSRGPAARVDGLMILADRANFLEDYDAVQRHLDEALTLVSDPPRLVLLPYLLERRVYLALARNQLDRAVEAATELLDSPGIQGRKTSRARSLLASLYLRRGDDALAYELFLACSQPNALPESPVERSMVFGGLLASAPDAETTTRESWLLALEASVPDPPIAHPTARYHVELAAQRLPPLMAYRCEQLCQPATVF